MVQSIEERKKKLKEYNQSPKGKKTNKIRMWKFKGLLCESQAEIDEIYERWLTSKKCEKCDKKYEEDNWKCMDHEHLDGKYGPFRNILCNRCNVNDKSTNTSGYPNVFYDNKKNLWQYRKIFKKKIHTKYFKKKEDAIEYKIKYENSLK